MGSRDKPRLSVLEGKKGQGTSLDDLIGYIKDDIEEIMKTAAAQAKGGNATVLTALLSLFTKHAENQQSDRGAAVMEKVLEVRAAALEAASAQSTPAKETNGHRPSG